MGTPKNGNRSKPGSKNGKGRRLALTTEEVQLVLAACQRYRHSIPVYLASSKTELRLVQAVIRKLS
jgi:hypothetical protein